MHHRKLLAVLEFLTRVHGKKFESPRKQHEAAKLLDTIIDCLLARFCGDGYEMRALRLGSFLFLLFVLQRTSTDALSDEGLILLKFKMNLLNSGEVLHSWNASSDDHCQWSGVRCDLTNMRVNYLNLPYRHLSGTISAELGKLNQLRRLGLHENDFTGSIPAELQNLTELKALYLRGNTLTGEIPAGLGDLFSLEILDVSRNALTGAIPDSLGNLSKLHFLNMSSNLLGGVIPATGSFPNFTSSSFQGNLNLCGPQVNFLCSGAAPPPAAPDTTPPCIAVSPAVAGLEVPREPITAKYLNGILVTITAVAVLLGVLTFSCSFLYYRKHSPGKLYASGLYQAKSPSAMARVVMFHGDLPYASKDILRRIELLDDTDIIGSGGFGTVYRLVMEDGNWFAVKKIGKNGLGSERFFERELEILGSFKHRNLVNLRGYCNSPSCKLLIYDYLPLGSLDEFLHEREPHEISLNWAARLKIAMGTARALAYLHHGCCPGIIHRDIKSSNILLDDKLEPHVSDFGLAKLLDDEESHVTTIVAGTFGYLAPEYMNNGRATDKGDVYSYGVVLLELLSGKRPTDACFVEKGLNVVGWVASCVREGYHQEIFDSKCPGPQKESMESVLQIAVMCIAANPDNRPSMEQVVQLLEVDNFTPWPSDLEYESDRGEECKEATKEE